MDVPKAIIAGSGVAGMAVAIRLAVKGYSVSVYEKNSYPGGKLSAFEKDGFHFDAGPSLFTQPQNIEELFALAGEPIADYFTYQPLSMACKYFFENGKTVSAYTNSHLFAHEMNEQLNEKPHVVAEYLQRSAKLYNNTANLFLNHSLHKSNTWINARFGKALAAIKLPHLFKSLHQYNSRKFSSLEATQLFDRFATYNGSNPYQAPAIMSLIPHLEQNDGAFYPTGGMISITNALYNLAKNKGVKFFFNSPVERIIHYENMARGVVVNGENILADIVVSNLDIFTTYKRLLNNDAAANKVLKQERSSSAVIFYWGMGKTFSQLQLHNIFFSKDYKKEFDSIFNKRLVSDDPTVYVNITAKMEAGQAPHEKENWFVMINAPANSGQNWQTIKNELRVNVLNKLNRMLGTDVEGLIETEQVLDPVLMEAQTSSYMGALYGSSSNSRMAAFLRHANFTSAIKGLYFCGGTVHPGGGIPLCLKSAKIVSEMVTVNNKKSKH